MPTCKIRKTKETEIKVELDLKGNIETKISVDNKFFCHMLNLFAAHSNVGLNIEAKSLDGDIHHLVEDTAITLGEAILEELGEKRGICRYSDRILPMDEALCLCALDVSGRGFCECDIDIKEEKTSDFETVLLAHFFKSLAVASKMTVHFVLLKGEDPHHIIEAAFKAFAHCFSDAIKIDPKNSDKIPSTKGVL